MIVWLHFRIKCGPMTLVGRHMAANGLIKAAHCFYRVGNESVLDDHSSILHVTTWITQY